jgi:hypothetical protein
MQISKLPLWICALALCGGLTLQAQDSAAQAAARAALMQKLNELNTNPPAATPSPAPATPAPVTVAPAAVATPAPATETPAAATFAPAAVTSPAPAVASPEATGTVQPGDTAAQAAARAALEQKMQELPSGSSAAPQTSAPVQSAPARPAPVATAPAMSAPPANAPANAPANVTGERTITAPAPPISMTKQEQLDRLLTLYKSNQLTPLQYHDQRAAILAQP